MLKLGTKGRTWLSFPLLILGCAVTALGIDFFLVPNRIAAGGLTGLATVIHHWLGWPVGLVTLALNVPLFLAGWRFLGGGFGIRTLIATFLLSGFIDLFSFLPTLTDDLLMAALAGGTLMGVGLGLVFRQEATTGGTDLAARLVHKSLPSVSVAQILLVIDVFVVLLASLVFRSYELGLYAVVALVMTVKLIDGMMVGVNYAKAAHIISEHPDRIADRLMTELNRGVTGLSGRGLYSKQSKEVLLCILRRREVPRLQRVVKEEDPDAFVFISDVREVFGEGFFNPE